MPGGDRVLTDLGRKGGLFGGRFACVNMHTGGCKCPRFPSGISFFSLSEAKPACAGIAGERGPEALPGGVWGVWSRPGGERGAAGPVPARQCPGEGIRQEFGTCVPGQSGGMRDWAEQKDAGPGQAVDQAKEMARTLCLLFGKVSASCVMLQKFPGGCGSWGGYWKRGSSGGDLSLPFEGKPLGWKDGGLHPGARVLRCAQPALVPYPWRREGC